MHETNFIATIGMAFATLFPLVNPVGAIPVFTSLTSPEQTNTENVWLEKPL